MFRTVSHLDFKQAIDKIDYPANFPKEFSIYLQKYISYEVINKLKEYAQPVIVSTAAPKCYAMFIGDLLRFNGVAVSLVLYSEVKNEDYFDNFKENKVLYFKENDIDIDIFLTDHIDDMPMIKASKEIILCNMKTENRNMIQQLFKKEKKIHVINNDHSI
jgi:phosphoserine phosphatase